jgi:hypothetical protein
MTAPINPVAGPRRLKQCVWCGRICRRDGLAVGEVLTIDSRHPHGVCAECLAIVPGLWAKGGRPWWVLAW